ncbi:MAG TPA: efflux RND transporter periplasmic adaptor subunit [Acetobacteraceae bacterium]|nr:efflux RND transporter periplasmic adaptor subunit [Acetobacteraceae bacterium]
MKRRLMIAGVSVAAVLGGAAAWYAHPAHSAPEPAAPPPVPVVAQKVRVSGIPIVLTGIGTVTAYNVVNVHAQVTGTIDKIGFVEGQTVHPGSLIAQLDPRPFQAALQQAEAALARDTAHLANARANLARYTPLLKQGYATAQQVDDQSSQVNQYEAAIASDKAAIFNAETQLGYTTITSPINGVTGIQYVDIGNIVQPSTATPIVTITQIQPISVVFTLPQSDLPRVQAAMARGPLHVIAYGQDGHTKLDEGTLLLVNNMVSSGSGTIQLKATFPNPKRTLWPGEFVNVRLVIGQLSHAVSVPIAALEQAQHGALVYVVTHNGTAQERAVTVGETLDGSAVIEKGLQPGDTVVTEGQYDLTDGTKVVRVPAGDPHVQNSTPASQGMLE